MRTLKGWSTPKSWGIWTDGKEATMTVYLDNNAISSIIKLTARAHGFAPKAAQTVDIYVNSNHMGQWKLDNHPKEVSIFIPKEILKVTFPVELNFRMATPSSPASHAISADPRNLGMGIEWLKIDNIEK